MSLTRNTEGLYSRGDLLNNHEDLIRDVVSKADNRSEDRIREQRALVEKYFPKEIGYNPVNPIYKAELSRYLEHMAELRYQAGTVCNAPELHVTSTALRELMSFNIINPLSWTQKFFNITDSYADLNLARFRMMREYNNQAANYVKLALKMFFNDFRNSAVYIATEMDRAYVSYNRIEHFFIPDPLVSLHHDITFTIASMESSWKGELERIRGSKNRRDIETFSANGGLFGTFAALTLPIASGFKKTKNEILPWLGGKIKSFWEESPPVA